MATVKARKPSAKTELPASVRSFVPPLLGYVPRQVAPDWTDADLLDQIWEANQYDGFCSGCGDYLFEGGSCSNDNCGTFTRHNRRNIAITGPTGSGKTSGLQDFAARHRLPFYTVSHMTSASNAYGRYVPDSLTGGLRWVRGPAWMIAQHGGVLYYDEINFLEPSVQAAFFSTLDFRRSLTLMEHPIIATCSVHGDVEHLVDPFTGIDHRECGDIEPWEGPYQVKLNKRTLVCCSYNPPGEYAGTNQLNAALANRFVTLSYPYSREVESQLIRCPAIAELGAALRGKKEIRTPVSTNRLIEFEQFIITTQDYTLAKTLFLGNFPDHEARLVRQALEDVYERRSGTMEGIYEFFGIDASDED